MGCVFGLAWRGKCGAVVVEGKEYCAEHIDSMCQCGEKATRQCDETMGPFVCGVPICGLCQHKLDVTGCNVRRFDQHVRSEQQEHLPWYYQDRITRI